VVHFPRGASLRSSFLTKRFFCDAATLQRDPNPDLCANARFASGSVLLDARPAIAGPDSGRQSIVSREGAARTAQRPPWSPWSSRTSSRPPTTTTVLEGLPLQGGSAARRYGYRLDLPTLLRPLLHT
jgi:hypothetical protein